MANERTDPFRYCYEKRAQLAEQAYERNELPKEAIVKNSKYHLGGASGAFVKIPFRHNWPVKEEVLAVANHFNSFLVGRTLNNRVVDSIRLEDASQKGAEPNVGVQYMIRLGNKEYQPVDFRIFGEASVIIEPERSSVEYKQVLEQYVLHLKAL